MARHRTKIIEKQISLGTWIFSFACRDCGYPADYRRKWYKDRALAVDDARAHRFAYRAIDAAILEGIFKGANK